MSGLNPKTDMQWQSYHKRRKPPPKTNPSSLIFTKRSSHPQQNFHLSKQNHRSIIHRNMMRKQNETISHLNVFIFYLPYRRRLYL